MQRTAHAASHAHGLTGRGHSADTLHPALHVAPRRALRASCAPTAGPVAAPPRRHARPARHRAGHPSFERPYRWARPVPSAAECQAYAGQAGTLRAGSPAPAVGAVETLRAG
ncbi:hypothetical protein [Streptomyces broussonetiae]|uniref:hypothetical protein n=1 Tax=Streptomyces broussonetiae TaxID=2686304 RepID=UPI0035D71E4B